MPTLAPVERLGSLIDGKYRIDSVLGEGGVGVVCAGQHTLTGRRVAIKLLHAQYARHAEVAQRFITEAQIAAQLEHPNIVGILDVGTVEDGTPYIVMEYLEGQSLSQRLAQGQGMSVSELAEMLDPIMEALSVAHEAGITHRDLKPDNIFLAETVRGQVPKLLDFGIAKIENQASAITRAGQFLGTPSYMAPEQIDGEISVGPPADVWAMGLVMLESLAAKRVFYGTPSAIVAKVTIEPTPRAAEFVGTLPPALARVIDRCLQKDRANRWNDMGEVLHAFRRAVDPNAAFSEAAEAASRPPWALVAVICLSLLGLVGVALFFLLRQPSEHEAPAIHGVAPVQIEAQASEKPQDPPMPEHAAKPDAEEVARRAAEAAIKAEHATEAGVPPTVKPRTTPSARRPSKRRPGKRRPSKPKRTGGAALSNSFD